jgi:hypothetical protein
VKRRTIVWLALFLTTAAARPAAAQGPRELLVPYLKGLEERAVGEVEGRAFGEPRRPSASPVPYDGVSVLLLPYAAEVDAKLDGIKGHLRDSLTHYVEAHADVTAVRVDFEREVIFAGGGELIRGAVTDSGGVLRLAGVPAGEWLLLGWREEEHALKGARPPRRDGSRFGDLPTTTGYAAVSHWRMRVSVRAGEVTVVDLSDRSVWLTAVREELTHPDAVPKKAATPRKRR